MGKPSIHKPTPKKQVDSSPKYKSGVCESYRPLLKKYDWDINIALAVMRAESGCRPKAYNGSNYDGSNDAGLFQINSIHVHSGIISDGGRFDPAKNIKAAFAIYQGSGWGAWSAYNNQTYLRYL